MIELGDGDRLLAAEYMLGVLGGAERREVERRLSREPALAFEVAFWKEELTGLTDLVAPVAPPQAGWLRIEAAIGAAARPSSVWQSLRFWRGLTIASAPFAAAGIAALAAIGPVPGAGVRLMAVVSGGAGQPDFVASATATGNTLMIVAAAVLTNDPRAYELWLIPPGGTRPHALGLIQPGQPVRLKIPSDLAGELTPDATLAVSLEPPGGSPTGLPTGPVIAAGRLTNM